MRSIKTYEAKMQDQTQISVKYRDMVKDNRNVFEQLALISIVIFLLLLEG